MPALELPSAEVTDFLTFLDAIYKQHFTGAVVLHFRDGRPQVAEIPAVQIRLKP